jgi:hypothetical protein
MSRSLTPDSSLEMLKKEAKRWLKALRAGDAVARHRLRAVMPTGPANPSLRDVQLALAREYGLPGWTALRQELDDLAMSGAAMLNASTSCCARPGAAIQPQPRAFSCGGQKSPPMISTLP